MPAVPFPFLFSLSLLFRIPHVQLQASSTVQSNPRSSAVTSADMKFLLIPLAFLLLRSGGMVVVIVYVYARVKTSKSVVYFLLYVAVSGTCGISDTFCTVCTHTCMHTHARMPVHMHVHTCTHTHTHTHTHTLTMCEILITIIPLFVQGIGDSGQGFVNAVLFCLFTAKVREKLKVAVKRLYYCRCWKRHSYTDLQYSTNSTFTESQTNKKVLMAENA